MVKILQISPSINFCGGVENYIMNYYRLVNKSEFTFDFAYHLQSSPNFYDEIVSLGGKVYKLPEFSIKNIKKIEQELTKILTENHYDAIHCHQANGAFLYMKVAKKLGIKVRILHSHQTQAADKFTHKIRNLPLLYLGKKRSNVNFACSDLAGKFLYGRKDFFVVNNAIDTTKFAFNEELRAKIRKELNISDDAFVIGHVGRFCNQKNQPMFISIAKNLLSSGFNNFKIVLVGNGETFDLINETIKKESLEKYFVLTGARTDTYTLYNVFDLFVLPSLYEGLPVVGVEAQYNGLRIITSTEVTKELNFSGNVRYLSLKSSKEWADSIIEAAKTKPSRILETPYPQYDIKQQCKNLEEKYLSLINKN